jgi:hypothetical protein
MGDGRTYDMTCAIRAVTSTDAMTAEWARLPHDVLAAMSRRIVNEVRGVAIASSTTFRRSRRPQSSGNDGLRDARPRERPAHRRRAAYPPLGAFG